MLISFKVANYKSFREPAILDLGTNRSDKTIPGAILHPMDTSDANAEVLAAAAIYGGNASGKTNFLMAMEYFCDAIAYSQANWRPGIGTLVYPNALDTDKPTLMEAVVVIDGTRYRYGFRCNRDAFVEEWLYSYPKGRERHLFSRTTESHDGELRPDAEFGPSLTGNLREFKSTLRRTRADSLLVSALAQDNQLEGTAVFRYFRNANQVINRTDHDKLMDFASGFTKTIPGFRELLLGLLQTADAGIADIELFAAESSNEKDDDRAGEPPKYDIRFETNIEDSQIFMPLSVQSRGVKGIYALSAALCMSLLQGALLIIDEIDAGLHPHLVAKIVSVFQNPSTNPNGAQMIFTTHDTHLLSIEHMRRDQIWFVEKEKGLSSLFALAEFSPRKDENLELSYLRGKYGGVPTTGLSLRMLGFPKPVVLDIPGPMSEQVPRG